MTNIAFAKKLKAIRRRAGWTQAECASKIKHLSVRTLEGWEAARTETPDWCKGLVLDHLAGVEGNMLVDGAIAAAGIESKYVKAAAEMAAKQ